MCLLADMAELADALDLGSSGESRAGSSPVIRIKKRPSGSFFYADETLDPGPRSPLRSGRRGSILKISRFVLGNFGC